MYWYKKQKIEHNERDTPIFFFFFCKWFAD